MAGSGTTTGLQEVLQQLEKIEGAAEAVAARSLYMGAGVMADAYASAVNSIETEPFRYAPPGSYRKPSPEEKAALAGKIGIAKFDKNGSEVGTSIGLQNAGYTQLAGKTKAVAQIANAIDSGTSFMHKQPVFRRARSKAKAAAEGAIAAEAEKILNELTK